MKTMELNEMEMVNGGSFWKYTVNKTKEKKCDKCGKYHKPDDTQICVRLPEMDVDNRPAIDLTLHCPTPQQV